MKKRGISSVNVWFYILLALHFLVSSCSPQKQCERKFNAIKVRCPEMVATKTITTHDTFRLPAIIDTVYQDVFKDTFAVDSAIESFFLGYDSSKIAIEALKKKIKEYANNRIDLKDTLFFAFGADKVKVWKENNKIAVWLYKAPVEVVKESQVNTVQVHPPPVEEKTPYLYFIATALIFFFAGVFYRKLTA